MSDGIDKSFYSFRLRVHDSFAINYDSNFYPISSKKIDQYIYTIGHKRNSNKTRLLTFSLDQRKQIDDREIFNFKNSYITKDFQSDRIRLSGFINQDDHFVATLNFPSLSKVFSKDIPNSIFNHPGRILNFSNIDDTLSIFYANFDPPYDKIWISKIVNDALFSTNIFFNLNSVENDIANFDISNIYKTENSYFITYYSKNYDRFLLRVEAQDQNILWKTKIGNIMFINVHTLVDNIVISHESGFTIIDYDGIKTTSFNDSPFTGNIFNIVWLSNGGFIRAGSSSNGTKHTLEIRKFDENMNLIKHVINNTKNDISINGLFFDEVSKSLIMLTNSGSTFKIIKTDQEFKIYEE